MIFTDALGRTIELAAPPGRIVSLVPSITETLFALGLENEIVGVTNFCIHPHEKIKALPKVGRVKNLDVPCILGLRPDLVIANAEENSREDVEALAGAGIAVYVCFPRTVEAAISFVRDVGALTGRQKAAAELAGSIEREQALARACAAGREPPRVFCAIWKNPYMSIGADTYIHDLIRVSGGRNIFCERRERYFATDMDEICHLSPDIILLPNEPYRFLRRDIAEFTGQETIPATRSGRIHIVPGESAVWFGSRTAEGIRLLSKLFWPDGR
ncbi:MAG: cobalamin-binding protein [Chloroflexi bacterium]|nr:cobalamin-binding protein [Chloroflexota bacterium]